MKRSFFAAILLAILSIGTFFVNDVSAEFSVTIAPATKVIELERGEKYSYDIGITNNVGATENQQFSIRVAEFTYDEIGNRAFVDPEEIADQAQALASWVKVPALQKTSGSQLTKFFVDISVPTNAAYGDHMGLIYVEKQKVEATQFAPVAIQGRLASVLIVKVKGGKALEKTGQASGFAIQEREKARNTATLTHDFQNTGGEFYYVETQVEIFDKEGDFKPIKTVKNSARVFPNVKKQIQVPIGDLGDDFGEKEYYLKARVQEQAAPGAKALVFGTFEKSFFYYVPVRDEVTSTEKVIEKEVLVMQPWIEVFKEVGLYVFGFIIILIVLIKVLFFNKPGPTKKR